MPAAAALFLFGLATALLSLQLPFGSLRAPGSGFFPLVLGLLLMGLAFGHALRLRLAQPPRPKPAGAAPPLVTTAGAAPPLVRTAGAAAPAGPKDSATRRVLAFMGAVALATALLPTLGYTAVSFLLMLALLQVLGLRDWRASGLIALGSAAGAYVVFVRWLKIPLPGGWIGF